MVWNTSSLTYYAEQLKHKRQLPKAYQDVEDDPHQMGGNFTLQLDNEENSFHIVHEYKSKSPPDRPTSDSIIRFLRNFK
jgi:hypothetical protein